ncbi:MAG: hypothetical protein HQM14_06405 [SAR324 cluster bacterium]|nr:hypothetical protein [SAR324 cluster bacterium]
MKPNKWKDIVIGSLLCIITFFGLFIWSFLSQYQGQGQLIYFESSKDRGTVRRVLPFHYPINEARQTISLSLEENKDIAQVKVAFSSDWLFFFEFELIQFLDHQGNLLKKIDFTQGEGTRWTSWSTEQQKHYLVSQSSLQKMAEEGLKSEVVQNLTLLKDHFFSSKEEFHEALKGLPIRPDWEERGVIRKYTQQPHYRIISEGATIISPEFSLPDVAQISFSFRSLNPTGLSTWLYYAYKVLHLFWLLLFIEALAILGIIYRRHTDKPWHLD